MAAPYVAGCVALLKSINNTLSPQDLKMILQASANPVGREGFLTTAAKQGPGLIDIFSAVRLISRHHLIGNATISHTPVCSREGTREVTLDAKNMPGYKKRIHFFETIRLDNYSKPLFSFPRGYMRHNTIRITWSDLPVLISGSSMLSFSTILLIFKFSTYL